MPRSSKTKTSPVVVVPTTKPALVLVPGSCDVPGSWNKVKEYLCAAGYQVYIPELPVLLDRTMILGRALDFYARFLIHYINDNQLVRPILIGHSTGATIAAEVLRSHPEIVYDKAILLSPITQCPANLWLSLYLPTKLSNKIYRSALRSLVATQNRLNRQDMSAIADYGEQINCRVLRATLRNLLSRTNNDFNLPMQLDFLAGEEDIFADHEQLLAWQNTLRAQSDFLPQCGHFLHYERPQQVAQKMIEFLEV